MPTPPANTPDNSLHEIEQELLRRRMDGSQVVTKARIAVDSWVMPMMIGAVQDNAIPWSVRLQAADWLTKVGDMMPKPNQVMATGASLQISINIPQPGSAPGEMRNVTVTDAPVINVTPAGHPPVVNPTGVIPLTDDDLPERPTYMKMPEFQLSRDLIGAPLPREHI